VGSELFHADGQTDKNDGAIVAFRNFANAPQKANKNTSIPTILVQKFGLYYVRFESIRK
jgi:hypothetical protein